MKQQVQLRIDVQAGDEQQRIPPQLTIVLGDSTDSQFEEWLVSNSHESALSERSSDSVTLGFAVDDIWHESSLVDELPGRSADDSEYLGSGPETTAEVGGSNDISPTDNAGATPLPESQRDPAERTARNGRRTLDLRMPARTSGSTSPATRTAVTPGSLATQTAIANVYAADVPASSDPSRWMIEPKPARMQVATFILSRTPRNDVQVAKPVAKPASTFDDVSDTNPAEHLQAPAVITQSSDSSHAQAVRVAKLPDSAEVTACPMPVTALSQRALARLPAGPNPRWWLKMSLWKSRSSLRFTLASSIDSSVRRLVW